MSEPKVVPSTEAFERALGQAHAGAGRYVLRLYVTGASERSMRAVANVRTLCERYLEGRYEIEVIDIFQQPLFAIQGQIVAAPTLVKEAPPPVRRLIGDMSDTENVIAALDIRAK